MLILRQAYIVNEKNLDKKIRLDVFVSKKEGISRSQAESFIRLGKVKVNGVVSSKTGKLVGDLDKVIVKIDEQYVSRAGLKLASVAATFKLDFRDKTVLDIGSSTGGFTDYALQHGAKKVIAVDVGTEQLHPKLRGDLRIDLREKTDFRDIHSLDAPDIVVIDVSFISIREILQHLPKLINEQTTVVAMVKPQFEAVKNDIKHKGVIKNDRMRRDILKDFEFWVKQKYNLLDKADSDVRGEKGNLERFYKLRLMKKG